jgi:uncharacterized coiled-coil DUF342 family protein
MSTPTPRTDAAWSATFDGEQMSAGQTARALREHSQELETELTTLRAELEKVYALVTPVGFDLPGGIFETAQAVTELRAERDQLRAALALGQQNCDDAYDDLRTERDAALARAERAEAERATERARLDSGQIMLTVSGERVWLKGVDLRAAIAAWMKEGAK